MKFFLITYSPSILNGKPVLKGSRISVEMIMEWIATGASVEAIYQKYPHLLNGSVEEAVQYAAQFSKNEILLEDELPS
jgi:uncharacterized protein (DUF433 family)